MKVKAVAKGDAVSVKMLIKHPMEMGRRKDAEGNLIPAHYITEVTVKYNGEIVFHSELGPGVSMDPYLAFTFDGAKAGESISLSWMDNKGQSERVDAIIGGT
ncbi:thiosulfate oxidation carrier complex protein SoxZ [Prosthecochloris sp.]|uniref:thiosulfate oxidation carrier complex protein SoxZ n=1 Tax=Prosthecochloris sp. TaxID=290513 RepID=UPI0025F52C1E|nr:thiosulfate oxidation carrier complex protein SoxZ [Prosthecochloris sp.]